MAKSNMKPKKDSLIDITRKYANNPAACIKFFFDMRWPNGYYCEKCGCTHYYFVQRHKVFECKHCGHQTYLLSGTIFQSNKLDLYKLILGLYLVFTSNKGISAVELASQLHVNYKTALLLSRKCRILMSESNNAKKLDSLFYEADVAYIGSKSNGCGKQGCGTDKQPFLVILATDAENRYPTFAKIFPISVDNSANLEEYITKSIIMSKECRFNPDGKTTFNFLKDLVQLRSEKIDYSYDNHRLKWINILIGNIKNQITGIYKGIAKRDLPLFLAEQAWRYNHRRSGSTIMAKIQSYIFQSTPMPRRAIVAALNQAMFSFIPV